MTVAWIAGALTGAFTALAATGFSKPWPSALLLIGAVTASVVWVSL